MSKPVVPTAATNKNHWFGLYALRGKMQTYGTPFFDCAGENMAKQSINKYNQINAYIYINIKKGIVCIMYMYVHILTHTYLYIYIDR